MNKEDVIRMAHEVGFWIDGSARAAGRDCISATYHRIDGPLERLVQAAYAAGAAAEREACAKVVEELHPGLSTKRAAEYIRSRGETK